MHGEVHEDVHREETTCCVSPIDLHVHKTPGIAIPIQPLAQE